MYLMETNNWKAFALFNEAVKNLENYQLTNRFQELTEAEKKLESAVSEDPTYDRAVYHLALVYDMVGSHKDAVSTLEKILDRDSKFYLEALYTLGIAHFHQYTSDLNEYNQAIKYFQQVKQKASEIVRSIVDKASTGSRIDEAELNRVEALSLLARAGLANVYAHLTILPPGQTPEEHRPNAEQYFNKVMEEYEFIEQRLDELKRHASPNTVTKIEWQTYNALGVALMYKGRREEEKFHLVEATNVLNKAKALNINTAVLSNLGTAAMFLSDLEKKQNSSEWEGYLDKSIEYFYQTLRLRPNYDFAYYRLARLFRKKGDSKQAMEYINLANKYRGEISEAQIKGEKAEIEAM